jgi:hypothetical protein
MVNGVQNVGFSNAVSAYKTIDLAVKLKIGFGKVFVVK